MIYQLIYFLYLDFIINFIFSATSLIFVSFSISSLLADRGSWLYLGGPLISLLNLTVLFSFVNLFLRVAILYQIRLYLGLFIMCGFILYDTQLIVEKHRMGSKDFIMHSLDLFIDFINVFRHLLVLLTQKVSNLRFSLFNKRNSLNFYRYTLTMIFTTIFIIIMQKLQKIM